MKSTLYGLHFYNPTKLKHFTVAYVNQNSLIFYTSTFIKTSKPSTMTKIPVERRKYIM